jgi:hypothetical protein
MYAVYRQAEHGRSTRVGCIRVRSDDACVGNISGRLLRLRNVCVGCIRGRSEYVCVGNITGRVDRSGGVYIG